MNETRILLIGNYGSKNIGDETILKGVARDILDAAPRGNVEIYVPTRNTGFVGTYHGELEGIVTPFHIYSFQSLLKALAKCNMVIIGGGGIWSGYTGPLAKLIPLFSLFAKASGKKVVFKSFGLYDTAAPAEKFLVNIGARMADGCSVRDRESYENLWASVRRKTDIVDDCAIDFLKKLENDLGLKEEYLEISARNAQYKKLESLSRAGSILVGVSVKPLKDARATEKIISAMSGCISMLGPRYKIVFFPFAKTESPVEDDVKMIERIAEKVPDKKKIIVLEHDNPLVYYFMIKHCIKKFVGMRYHSIIFSSMAGTQFLAVPYENKVSSFLESIGHEESVAPADVTPKRLMNFLKAEGAGQ